MHSGSRSYSVAAAACLSWMMLPGLGHAEAVCSLAACTQGFPNLLATVTSKAYACHAFFC
jgi:hypothetical protein